MTELIDYNAFVNENNKDLIDAILKSGCKIELYKEYNTNVDNTKIWTCKQQDKTFILTFYAGEESIEYFTHEILHAYYLTNLKFADTKEFHNDVQTDSDKTLFIPLSLIGQINNIFAHEKFYTTYIQRNFLKEKFTSDFNNIPVFYQNEIETQFNEISYPNYGILFFISSFFSCKDCRSGLYENEINNHLDFLRQTNYELFEILNSSWENWLTENKIDKNKDIISKLILEIQQWYKQKTTNN